MLVGMDIGDARGGKNDHRGRFVSVNASLFNSPKYLGVKNLSCGVKRRI